MYCFWGFAAFFPVILLVLGLFYQHPLAMFFLVYWPGKNFVISMVIEILFVYFLIHFWIIPCLLKGAKYDPWLDSVKERIFGKANKAEK